jgi:ParB-like chromosome segregation protein Spo0J
MKATAELKMLPVSVLKPAAYNPRKKLKPGDKEYEKIKNSIEEFGFADPLVVNADMTIIGGHQRLTVAMALAIPKCLVRWWTSTRPEKKPEHRTQQDHRRVG